MLTFVKQPRFWTAHLAAFRFIEEEFLSVQARDSCWPHSTFTSWLSIWLFWIISSSKAAISSPLDLRRIHRSFQSPYVLHHLASLDARTSSPRKFSETSLRSKSYSVNDIPPVHWIFAVTTHIQVLRC
ncbi:hypothetical protein DL96DRAFT_1822697 [Flagelloscypha sp. PMI_526]|nr:hypothetical protein DL96DRAFT_1822697 [Flagelloscypha sp. PMI_526]